MNTREFIYAFADKLNISQKDAAKLLHHTTGTFRDIISDDNKLTLLHLGTFKAKLNPSRTAYIPALDQKALVPPHRVVQFHPTDSLKDKFKKTDQL